MIYRFLFKTIVVYFVLTSRRGLRATMMNLLEGGEHTTHWMVHRIDPFSDAEVPGVEILTGSLSIVLEPLSACFKRFIYMYK